MIKETTYKIRLSKAERGYYNTAAEYSGLCLADWIRTRLRAAAVAELENLGVKTKVELLKDLI